MALFGRDSPADLQRIERVKQWVAARTPWAIFSVAAGLLAIVDCWTLVIGIAAGIGAILCGVRGLRDLAEHPHLTGRRLCITGIILGGVGLLLSFIMWMWVFPALSAR